MRLIDSDELIEKLKSTNIPREMLPKTLYQTKFVDYVLEAYKKIVLEMQARTEETSDKYKWHDLRKDPNDLPNESKCVLICFEFNDIDNIRHRFYEVQFFNESYNWFHGHQKGWVEKVIAWKEIEPFEEEE